jgi:hypothetical protein
LQIEPERIRERYNSLPTAKLREIVAAGHGQYTAEAVGIASEVLGRRGEEPEEVPPAEETGTRKKRSEVWAVVAAMAVGGHFSRPIFAAVRAAEEHPDAVQRMGLQLLLDPWTYIALGIVGIVVWRRHSGIASQ